MTPRAVILDFYGTLAETPDWGPSWDDVLAELGYELPVEVRDRWWHDGIDGTEHDEHSVSRDHYVAWQQSRLRVMLADCGVSPVDQDRFIERVREISGHRRIKAFAEVQRTLAALRERGVVLAICSNWDWDLEEAVESAGLATTVDVMISSAWVGARKPHPRIYSHALLDSCGMSRGRRAVRRRHVELRRRRATRRGDAGRVPAARALRSGLDSSRRPRPPYRCRPGDGPRRGARATQLTARSRPSQYGARSSRFSTFIAPDSGSGSVRI